MLHVLKALECAFYQATNLSSNENIYDDHNGIKISIAEGYTAIADLNAHIVNDLGINKCCNNSKPRVQWAAGLDCNTEWYCAECGEFQYTPKK